MFGTRVARWCCMDDDLRYEFACRMGLLGVSLLHWAVAGLILFDRSGPSVWEFYTEAGWRFASSLAQSLIGAS